MREEAQYTYVRLVNDPHARHLAQPFEDIVIEVDGLRQRWFVVQDDENRADARVTAADDDLDESVVELENAIDTISHNDPKSPLRQRYFRNKTPSAFKRPTLGSQLKEMDTWPDSLMSSPHLALREIGKRLVPKLKEAHEALAERSRAVQARRDFREVDERPQFVDKLNVLRYNTHAALVEIQSRPELKLPKKYPDRFFKTRSSSTPTEASLRADIEATETKLAKLKAALDELLKNKAEKEKVQRDKKVAAKETERAKLLKKKAELQAQLKALDEDDAA